MAYVTSFFNKKMLQIEGECLLSKTIEEELIYNFYEEITKTGYDFIEINSSLQYNTNYEIGIRRAGYLRPVGLFSTTLSILVDLTKPIEYDKNWQKNSKKAENQNLSFRTITNPIKDDFQDYLLMEGELKHRKKFHNGLSTVQQLEALFFKNEFFLFFVENEQKQRVAGMIIHTHNSRAISVYSVTTKEGRAVSASFFLRKKMFSYLAECKNIKDCDMGRISPSSSQKNNLYLFKNGVKGEHIVYNGEWSWYKRRLYRPLMYFVKKYLFKRTEV
ncbi:MAG: hypothetical protein P4L28_06275 [Paludibacteraceae bacterium]|nr:hypothetical protein [Paludibacteraceae bacterium]